MTTKPFRIAGPGEYTFKRDGAGVVSAPQPAWDVAAMLGRQVVVHTRKGHRRHVGVVVATRDPEAHARWPMCRVVSNPSGLSTIKVDYRAINAPRDHHNRWSSALSRERYLTSPRSHRFGNGRLIVRIESSTAPNMVGRYIHVDGRLVTA